MPLRVKKISSIGLRSPPSRVGKINAKQPSNNDDMIEIGNTNNEIIEDDEDDSDPNNNGLNSS